MLLYYDTHFLPRSSTRNAFVFSMYVCMHDCMSGRSWTSRVVGGEIDNAIKLTWISCKTKQNQIYQKVEEHMTSQRPSKNICTCVCIRDALGIAGLISRCAFGPHRVGSPSVVTTSLEEKETLRESLWH